MLVRKSSHVLKQLCWKAPFRIVDGSSILDGTSRRYVDPPTGRQGAYGKGRGHGPECTCNQRTCCRFEPIATAAYGVSASLKCDAVAVILLWVRIVAFLKIPRIFFLCILVVAIRRIEFFRCLLDRLVNGVAHPLVGSKVYL
jgi:hypothetical protein